LIYRVDYVVAVILAGLIVGALLSRLTSRVEPARLARGYFVFIAVLVGVRVVAFVCSIMFPNASVWNTIGRGSGDTSNFLLGGIFGIAARRPERRAVLCDPAIYSALCLSAGIALVLAGYAKALYMDGMIQFFAQLGFSTLFLKFIMTIEILGGIGLLIPWTALPAGLSIDMFGAVYTHIHNRDSINDNTGAIGALIRFGVIVALWAWRPRPNEFADSIRRRFVGVGVAAVICLGAAVSGSALMRRVSVPKQAGQAKAFVFGNSDSRHLATVDGEMQVRASFRGVEK